jgi:5,5'-dehydrodivanillate O-demethylase oxygenase subunit
MSTRLQFADLEPVGPGTPSGSYLRRFWQPVARERDLKSGRAKPLEILGERFTIYRGESGVAHVTEFSCAHRRTQLSTGWVEGDSLRCRYHGWRFDGDGQCVEQPNEQKPFCARVKLKTYPTREHYGLVFAYFGEGEPPNFPLYPDLEKPGVIVADPPEVLPCGFWNRLDNDMGHIPWVHRATAQRRGWDNYLVIRGRTAEEAAYGAKITRLPADGETSESLGLRVALHFFMPNAQLFFQRTRAKGFENRDLWDAKYVWTVPVNDQKYVNFDVTNTPLEGEEAHVYAATRLLHQEAEAKSRWDLAEKVLAGEMTLEELPDDLTAATTFEIEDYVTQVGQRTVAGRGHEWLGPSDTDTIIVRRLWLREVTALVEGHSLTDWQIPAEPLADSLIPS